MATTSTDKSTTAKSGSAKPKTVKLFKAVQVKPGGELLLPGEHAVDAVIAVELIERGLAE